MAEESELDDAEIENYRQRVEDSLFEVIGQQDKYLLTLSSALIAATIGFASTLSGPGRAGVAQIGLLYVAWWLWFSCIVFVLFSFASSQFAHQRILKSIENGKFHQRVASSCWATLVTAFNILGFVCFIAAGVLFLVTATINIK